MRALPAEITTYLQQNSAVKVRRLLWITARNRDTGEPETHGLWDGEDTTTFVVDGETRVYYGFGQFVNWGELTIESTLNIRKLSAVLAPITPEVEQVLRGYDPKFAPVQVHLAFFNPETNNLVAPPLRMFKGWVDKFPLTTPPVGGSGQARLDMVGHTRILTNRLALKRSDETQRRRSAGDSFYSDVTVTGQVQTPWGSK